MEPHTSYLVLVAGFYFAPQRPDTEDVGLVKTMVDESTNSSVEYLRYIFALLWGR